MSLIGRLFAKINHVPYKTKVWYNFQAYISESRYKEYNFVLIFDKDHRYIPCPTIGSYITYCVHGDYYKYKVVGFDNNNRDSDWLNPSDYINPIIQYVNKL